jgi:hypothetical protein
VEINDVQKQVEVGRENLWPEQLAAGSWQVSPVERKLLEDENKDDEITLLLVIILFLILLFRFNI